MEPSASTSPATRKRPGGFSSASSASSAPPPSTAGKSSASSSPSKRRSSTPSSTATGSISTRRSHVEYRVAADRIDIRIADEGAGYDPSRVRDCKADANLERPGGRGLLLMRHYMTEVVVVPPGNELVMSKVHVNGYAHKPDCKPDCKPD